MTDIDFGWGRRDKKVLATLTVKQRKALAAADAACLTAYQAYLDSLKQKAKLELELGLIKGRDYNADRPRPATNKRK